MEKLGLRNRAEEADWAVKKGLENRRSLLSVRDLEIELDARRVKRGGERLGLTKTEFELLAYLAKNAGRAICYEELVRGVWRSEPSRGTGGWFRCA
jgi:DNA-binding response OmpR family regulator